MPSGVNWLYAEDQVRGPELSVLMHVYLGTEDEVQVLSMDGSDVLNKYFAVCKKASVALVSKNKNLLQ